MNEATLIRLGSEQRNELERRVRSQTIDVRIARRARIVLLAANGVSNHEIARRLKISRGQVISWRKRFHKVVSRPLIVICRAVDVSRRLIEPRLFD